MAGVEAAGVAVPASPPSVARARVDALERNVGILQREQANLENKMGQFTTTMNSEIQAINARTSQVESTLRQGGEEIARAFDTSAAQRSAEMAQLIADATAEFATQRATLQNIAQVVEEEFQRLKQQIEQSAYGGESKTGKGFLPVKELKPPKLGKEDQWRDWSEHFAEFAEATCSGMKNCLKAVAKMSQRASKEMVASSPDHASLAYRSEGLYSALKHLTEEKTTARRVVNSTPQEDGFTAWWSLNSTFTQALASRQSVVMSQFTACHAKSAKNQVRLGLSSSRSTMPSKSG